MTDLKALSINNPWGWAIAAGLKDIENRDWGTKFRGEFLIHVGLKIDKAAWEFIRRTSDVDPKPAGLLTGGIIGKAEIVDCVTESDSPWFFGRYGFVIRNAELLPFRPCKGALGFFKPDYSSVYARDKPKWEEKYVAAGNLDQPAPNLFDSTKRGFDPR